MIILFHEEKIVYFTIPKCACTSIKLALYPLTNQDNALPEDLNNVHFGDVPFVWVKYKDRANIFQEYPDYFKFAFVRNPWDRLISFYGDKIVKFTERYGDIWDGYKSFGFTKDMSFETFASRVCEIGDEEADVHFRSQHSLILDNKNIQALNFIGRFENLHEDWEKLIQLLPSTTISRLNNLGEYNPSHHAHYSTYYSPELRGSVAKRYQDDIELFGYTFEEEAIAGSYPKQV